MEYNFREIEKKWQQHWQQTQAYKVSNTSHKPKFYVLDMFPYPSGAGLHVGHPLGYIASDIFARYKRLKGFNVLHPMGYDAFGLPAEQYALEHGVHPSVSTEQNINNFRKQLDNIGFSYDWSREVITSEPAYYKWTQWIFLQLFKSFYNRTLNKAQSIDVLVNDFVQNGNINHPIPDENFVIPETGKNQFSAAEWVQFSDHTRELILLEYRLAFCGYGEVNWCEALGTVLANDEVVNGVSERGGHPVVKKKLRQWYLRITEYADRLLEGLETVDFSDAMKDMQSNWIGKSTGAEVQFAVEGSSRSITVYTTRPDTIFGVDFIVLAPEHEWLPEIVTNAQNDAVIQYIDYVESRSERERIAEKKISGVFTGSYALHPFTGKKIPIWISEYVLAGYGTGAIMAVPSGDERDHRFAKHFNIPITNIFGEAYTGEEAVTTKEAVLHNSDFLTGLNVNAAANAVIERLLAKGRGKKKTNFKIRDAAFSRQRYWGEPFPIQWKNDIPYPLSEAQLPLKLPYVESYKPGPEGDGPLANIEAWTENNYETNTMPGYAGSSWYFLRFMDPHNTQAFCSQQASAYWNQVDIYIGGTEHAVGHLLYSRMWTKFLFDRGWIGHDEPFKKLVNQGMIQGSSRFVYRIHGTNTFVSHGLKDKYTTNTLHVDVNIVDGVELDITLFKTWKNAEFADAQFILENGKYICGTEVEKMSKSKFNTINPDQLVEKYGADTFRMYEMFLGPIEQSKPWDTKGIEGVHRFLKKLWRLFYGESGLIVTDDEPTADEWKALHKTIKKVEEDTERFSFNTAVSAFMVCVNELTDVQCHKKAILQPLLILLTPFAPHFAEELWKALGNAGSILDAPYPAFDEKYLIESSKSYPVSINGKLRTTMLLPLNATQTEVEAEVLKNEVVQKWMEDKPLKKFIFVKGKMINLVI